MRIERFDAVDATRGMREINARLNLLDRTWDLGRAAGKHQQNRKCQPTKPQDDPGR